MSGPRTSNEPHDDGGAHARLAVRVGVVHRKIRADTRTRGNIKDLVPWFLNVVGLRLHGVRRYNPLGPRLKDGELVLLRFVRGRGGEGGGLGRDGERERLLGERSVDYVETVEERVLCAAVLEAGVWMGTTARKTIGVRVARHLRAVAHAR